MQTKLYKSKQSCTLNLSYNENNLMGRWYRYFCIYFECFFIYNYWNIVFAGIIYSSYEIRWFYSFSLQALFIWDNKEITECVLLSLFPFKSWLFRIYECNRSNCFKNDTRRFTFIICFPMHWWHNDNKVWVCRNKLWLYKI